MLIACLLREAAATPPTSTPARASVAAAARGHVFCTEARVPSVGLHRLVELARDLQSLRPQPLQIASGSVGLNSSCPASHRSGLRMRLQHWLQLPLHECDAHTQRTPAAAMLPSTPCCKPRNTAKAAKQGHDSREPACIKAAARRTTPSEGQQRDGRPYDSGRR